jgi:hypothetical protein
MSIVSGKEWILYPVRSATLRYALAKVTANPRKAVILSICLMDCLAF